MADAPYMKTADKPGTLEKQIEDLRDEVARLRDEAAESYSAMIGVAREHPKGTSTVLLAVGAAGFLLGLACGAAQSSHRSRYW